MDAGGTSSRMSEGRIMQEQLSRATQEQLPKEGLFSLSETVNNLCNCLSLTLYTWVRIDNDEKKDLQEIAQAAAKNIKSEADLNELK